MQNTNVCKCCICGVKIIGSGNNLWPLSENEDDRCCDDCNNIYVIPARIKNLCKVGNTDGEK